MPAKYFNPTYYGGSYRQALEKLADDGEVFKDTDEKFLLDFVINQEIIPPENRTPDYLKRLRGGDSYLVSLGIEKPRCGTYEDYNTRGDRGHAWLELAGYKGSDKHFHFGTLQFSIPGSNRTIGMNALSSDAKATMSDNWGDQRADYAILIPINYTQWRLLNIDRMAMQLRTPGYNAVSASCENYSLQSLHDVGINIEELLGKELSQIPFADTGLNPDGFHDAKLKEYLAQQPDITKITTLTLADDFKELLEQASVESHNGVRYRKLGDKADSPVIVDLTELKQPTKLHEVASAIRNEQCLPNFTHGERRENPLPDEIKTKVRAACNSLFKYLSAYYGIAHCEDGTFKHDEPLHQVFTRFTPEIFKSTTPYLTNDEIIQLRAMLRNCSYKGFSSYSYDIFHNAIGLLVELGMTDCANKVLNANILYNKMTHHSLDVNQGNTLENLQKELDRLAHHQHSAQHK